MADCEELLIAINLRKRLHIPELNCFDEKNVLQNLNLLVPNPLILGWSVGMEVRP